MCKNVLKYDSFIMESIVAKIFEGNLMATDNFINRLSSIGDNQIASTLLKAFSDKKNIEKDLPMNWIDVTDKEDMITFMADRGATRLNNNPESIFSARGRNEVKIGKLARSIMTELGIPINDKEIEIFVNSFKSSKVDTSKRFEIVSGADIKKYYAEGSYVDIKGSLGGSCMRYEDCQRFFKIYTKNPDSCRMLVYLDSNNKLLGRALVWKIFKTELSDINSAASETKKFNRYLKMYTVTDCNAEYFMDRIYTVNDSDMAKFITYAKDNKWIYKYKMTADEKTSTIFKYGEKILVGKVIVKLQRALFSKYPFFDTLAFNNGDSLISNVGFAVDPSDHEDVFIMGSAKGDFDICDCKGTGYDDDGTGNCRKCEGEGELDCVICRGTSEIFCNDCDGEGEYRCMACNGDGDVECTSCIGSGVIACDLCYRAGVIECAECNSVGNLGKCPECTDGENICPECNGDPVTCVICLGEGFIDRKWGNGTRRISCTGCGGVGRSTTGNRNRIGCRCSTCSQAVYLTRTWENIGKISCLECDGYGFKACGCGGEGSIECPKCDGQGGSQCGVCRQTGGIECVGCSGTGRLEECDKCKGFGTLGDCRSCENGSVECIKCSGTGKRPEGSPPDLCPKCAGLADLVRDEIFFQYNQKFT